MASMWPPKKNTAFTLCFTLYKNDGTVIANPGTLTRAVSVDLGAVDTTPVNAVTEEDTTYGQLSWVLDAAEMNGDVIWVYCVDDTAGCVPFTCTLYTTANTQDEIGAKIDTVDDYLDTELAAITAAVITDAAGTNIGADTTEILTRLPDATAGANGGLLIAGSNAATTFASVSVTGQLDAGNVLVDTTTVLTGNVTISGTLGVGVTTLSALTVTNNLLISGTTTFTGAVTLSSTLGTGAVTLSALTVTNLTTLTGNVSLGGTLGITGAVTLSSTLATGAVTLSALTVTNNFLVSGTTTHTGAVTLTGGIAAGAISGTLANDLITAASINTGAFTADAFAADAIVAATLATGAITADAFAANALVAGTFAANSLDGKGNWNIGKTGYALTQTFPTNFADLSISATTGLVDITQTAADKTWGTATRVLTAGTNLSFSTHSAADVANLILVTPAQKIVTNAAGEVDANIQSINDAALTGNGTVGTPWGPA